MPIYFVGPGGNDGNNGLTWALRKLTLNGAEDVPVVAGDTVYVGPGVYREMLTVDVSGGAGNVITYIGDVTGENTDGVGGIVRITGSDNDQTRVRTRGIYGSFLSRTYRIFRGFSIDMCTQYGIYGLEDENWTIEDCFFQNNRFAHIYNQTTTGTGKNWIIRRCGFWVVEFNSIWLDASATIDDSGIVLENLDFFGGASRAIGVEIRRFGDVIVRNTNFMGGLEMITVSVSPNAGHPCVVNNSIFQSAINRALRAAVLGDLTENFNTFFGNGVNRTNVAVGAQSQAYPALFLSPVLFAGAGQISGTKYPWWHSELSEWSQIRAITGANERTEDLRGLIRPGTASKNSWGSAQFMEMERATGTVRTGISSMVLLDAGINQMFIPITAEQITVEVYVQREANYAGVNPQMIIKQPGQADRVTLDAGLAGFWNQLTDTFTPAALPPYVIIEFVSNNTAAAGAYSTFFDDLEVS